MTGLSNLAATPSCRWQNAGNAGGVVVPAGLGTLVPQRDVTMPAQASLLPMPATRPCPVPRAIRSGSLGMLASMFLHGGIAAAALVLLPQVIPDKAERGGQETVLEVTLVGEAAVLASTEGARPEPVALVLPDVTDTGPPEFDPVPSQVPPVEELPPAPVLMAPLPDLPATLPADLHPPKDQPVLDPPRPVSRGQQAHRRVIRDMPAKDKVLSDRKTSRVQPSRQQSNQQEARGRSGEGSGTTTRQATAQGGSGGAGASAGQAAFAGYGARIRALIERQKTYPEQAQERGQTGRTQIVLALSRDGRVASVSVTRGSGHALLDAATLAAVRRAQPFPPLPDGMPTSVSFTLSIGYELR